MTDKNRPKIDFYGYPLCSVINIIILNHYIKIESHIISPLPGMLIVISIIRFLISDIMQADIDETTKYFTKNGEVPNNIIT